MASTDLRVTYLIETPLTLEEAANAIAGEQSTGTFVAVPLESEGLKARAGARVERVQPMHDAEGTSLPGALPGRGHFARGEVTIRYPFGNVGTNLPLTLTTMMGNLFELRELSAIRVLDFDPPSAYQDRAGVPRFGIEGTRLLTGVHDRPIIGTIVKPSVGLSPQETAEVVRELAAADVDFVKDDELQANAPHSPFDDRVRAVMRVVNDHAEASGRRVMVAFNVTDDLEAMYRHHDVVVQQGGTCIMVSLNSVGPVAVQALRAHSQLPIHGHRNGWGMYTRHPALGMSFTAYQKIWRLIGVDHLHVNGFDNKFWESDASVLASIRACQAPLFGGLEVLPVISSGQTVRQVPRTYKMAGTVDLMFLAGGGIMAHPGGPRAGVTAIRQAWTAAVSGVPLTVAARDRHELSEALATFGAPS
jgi:ribulose-bisphosphate carboxylase large chain